MRRLNVQRSNKSSLHTAVDRKFFDGIAKELGIRTQHDWYSVSVANLPKSTQRLVRQQHRDSLYKSLKEAYPEYTWRAWQFSSVPLHFWSSFNNQVQFMDWVAEELGVEVQEDWYRIPAVAVEQYSISLLASYYGSSLIKALEFVYPQYTWHTWKFEHTPSNFWHDVSNQRKLFDWLAETSDISQQHQWYDFNPENVSEKRLHILLNSEYKGSLYKALSTIYPEYIWHAWIFPHVPAGFWSSLENRRNFFDWVGEQLNIQQYQDWYRVESTHVAALGGAAMLRQYYANCVSRAVFEIYPQHPWKTWGFARVPKGFWSNEDNLNSYLGWLEGKLKITTEDDWKTITRDTIKTFRGKSVLDNPMVKARLDSHTTMGVSNKTEKYISRLIQQIFPNTEILHNFKTPFKFSNTQKPMELDIYLPSLSLGFEYQGYQHYFPTRFLGESRPLKDREKERACNIHGITLITIPFWWNKEKSSIIATIHKQRPDLISDPGDGLPIPDEMPENLQLFTSTDQLVHTY